MSIQRCCPPKRVVRADYGDEAALFAALSDEHRLAIVASLAQTEGEICVCDFTKSLPLNQPTVSHHLRILRESGLVTGERRRTWVYYRLAPDAKRRLQYSLRTIFEGKVSYERAS
jgi:ArsR family transcriptional regulator, arsenate/arsenite/antimonite-responsive transcriptional repressor